MQNKQFRHYIYQARRYMTTNNVVLAIALVIAASWAISSVGAVQRNYELQRSVNDQKRRATLIKLQNENLQYQQHYYKSSEYLTLEAKRRLGLAEPGESVLILPTNSPTVVTEDNSELAADNSVTTTQTAPPPAPIKQWLDFLFGAKPQDLQN